MILVTAEGTRNKVAAGLSALMIPILVICFVCVSHGMETGVENGEENSVECYHISRVQGEIDWDKVPTLDLDHILWLPDQGVRAFGQFCYDKDMLYVHLRATESDIRAENTEPLSPVCQDSCLEFFFMPEGEDRYFNYEINPNGCLYIGFGHGRSDSTALYREDIQDLFAIKTDRTEDGWEVYYRIPVTFLQLFYPGYSFSGILRANVYKCGDLTSHKHYLSWNAVKSEKPDFHRPEDFGMMVFDELPSAEK